MPSVTGEKCERGRFSLLQRRCLYFTWKDLGEVRRPTGKGVCCRIFWHMSRRSGLRATFWLWRCCSGSNAPVAIPSQGATFGLGTLIEVGLSGSGANGAVLKAGDNGAASAITGSAASFANNAGRWFEIVYSKPANMLTVKLYTGSTNASSFTTVNYSPTGAATVGANAIWTIPASAFFVTAASGPVLGSSITIQNLTLSGLSGGLNIISPMQQTTLSATRGIGGGTATGVQSGDIVFQGDNNGSWMLSGLLTMTGILPVIGPAGTDLEFGFSANASTPTVPETSSLPMMGTGLAVLIVFGRKKVKAHRR